MVIRRGTSSVGCLTSLIALGVLVYLGSQIVPPYFRYYQFRDAIAQEGRFAGLRTDEAIQKNIWANADSLTLPEEAYHVRIRRGAHSINIQTDYDDSWTVGKYTRPVHFLIDITNSL